MTITMDNEVKNVVHVHIFELTGHSGQFAVYGETPADAWANLFKYLSMNTHKYSLHADDSIEIEYIEELTANPFPSENNLVVKWR